MQEELSDSIGLVVPLFADCDGSSSDGDDSGREVQCNCSDVKDGIAGVETIDSADISPELFLSRFRMKVPVIMKNLASQWPAVEKWKAPGGLANSLLSAAGTTLVSKDNINFLYHELCDKENIPIRDAVAMILGDGLEELPALDRKMYCRMYLDSHPELISDFDSNALAALASHSGGLIEDEFHFASKNVGIWVSSKGCITPLHYDLCHGFLSQIVGQKEFLLAPPSDTQYLYRNVSIDSKNQTSSRVDIFKWLGHDPKERITFPNVAEAQWFRAELSPGDVLYTPPGWWHAVTSVDESVSVLLPFDMTGKEHLSVLQSL